MANDRVQTFAGDSSLNRMSDEEWQLVFGLPKNFIRIIECQPSKTDWVDKLRELTGCLRWMIRKFLNLQIMKTFLFDLRSFQASVSRIRFRFVFAILISVRLNHLEPESYVDECEVNKISIGDRTSRFVIVLEWFDVEGKNHT